ncbi:hypothetical protein BDA96_04G179400 [Sorghum bicolor]|uniref:Uncharacterized protein n=1 Tax=Sorghum bicolor TaxID=4558 RepID=A0A921R3G4_SORBI|nr:hypothetical protein BDA96_04G179400 [Sorghum bicolor]
MHHTISSCHCSRVCTTLSTHATVRVYVLVFHINYTNSLCQCHWWPTNWDVVLSIIGGTLVNNKVSSQSQDMLA